MKQLYELKNVLKNQTSAGPQLLRLLRLQINFT